VPTIAGAQTTVLPQYAAVLGRSHSGTPEQMVCTAVPAYRTASYSKLAGRITTGSASQTCGFAIYPDSDGGAQLGEASGSCATSNTNVSATGLSFSLVAGTRYRLCTCSTSTATDYMAVRAGGTADTCVSGNDDGCISRLLNQLGTATSGTAAEPCVTGNPPATTGAITPVDSFPPPMLVIE